MVESYFLTTNIQNIPTRFHLTNHAQQTMLIFTFTRAHELISSLHATVDNTNRGKLCINKKTMKISKSSARHSLQYSVWVDVLLNDTNWQQSTVITVAHLDEIQAAAV